MAQNTFTSSSSLPSTSFTSTPPPPAASPTQPPWESAVRPYAWVLALIVLASLGLIAVISIQFYVLARLLVAPASPGLTPGGPYPGRPWRAHWLGQTLLGAIFCCYATLFAYLPYSSAATCAITRFCVGASYGLCFSVLLVKLLVVLGARYGELSCCVQASMLFFVFAVQVVKLSY